MTTPPWPDTPLRLGTCSWTAKGWESAFYPEGLPKNEYIAHYATRFSTVEIDSTFYATPPVSNCERWRQLTPEGFLFAAKFPRAITHDKFLEDCGPDTQAFLHTMAHLGSRLGPLLIQFPYFAKGTGITLEDFLERLRPFLKALPREELRFAVEVRNKPWVTAALLDVLRDEGVALALTHHPWMPPPKVYAERKDILTADFSYVRLLGDRKGIEKITKTWSEVVVDRNRDNDAWTPFIRDMLAKGQQVFGYVNNHYSGYAVADVEYLADKLKA